MDTTRSFLDDSLYCDEEKWGELVEPQVVVVEQEEEQQNSFSLFPNLLLLEQDLFWDDEELKSLFNKEKESCFLLNKTSSVFLSSSTISLARKEAVEWILKTSSHYGFSPLTAILAVNYLDRFLAALNFQKDGCNIQQQQQQQPWMMQLAAVTCLSLAAKVEETYVPLLLDLQVVKGKEYVFEAKTIQKMELLVLTSLKWRMNPVTPLSFLDHIIRRLGLKSYIHWEFLRSCENLLLSVVSDSRSVSFPPSVLATATMLHVIHQFEPSNNAMDYENQLLSVLKISKDEVDECYELLSDILSNSDNALKRKFMDYLSCDSSSSSNDSSSMESCISSTSSTPEKPLYKKARVQEQQMKLPSLSKVFVDAIKSPH